DHLPILFLLNGDVRHGRGPRRSMPVLLAWRKPDHVSWTNLLDGSTVALYPAAASRNNERLAERMRVPCSSCSRLERNAGALNQSGVDRLKERVDPRCASEPLRWSLRGRLRTNSFDFYFFASFTAHLHRIPASYRECPTYSECQVCTPFPPN